jgi:hypothetical protein
VIGGTISVLGGGKFANGAHTGAYQYIFNQAVLLHSIASKLEQDGRAFRTMLDQKIEGLMRSAIYVGFGGSAVLPGLTGSADTGIAIDTSLNVCLQTTQCYGTALTKDVGGTLGIVLQGQQGVLKEGQQFSAGFAWAGGRGLAGEGQVQYGEDGFQFGRGLFGVGYSSTNVTWGTGITPRSGAHLACQTTTVTCVKSP